MIIPSVGKQKISYKDHSEVNFEPLDFYINLSKKIIAKMGSSFFNGLSKDMLKSEDSIAFVANAIMMGDWRWKQNNDDIEKQNKSLYSYRNQCAIWAMKTYVTKQYKNKYNNKKIKTDYSINHQTDSLSLESIIQDNSQREPIDIIIEKENNKEINDLLSKFFESDIISDKQKEYIKLYYFEKLTLEKIGKKFGVTREAIRQSLRSAIKRIRELV
jgi:RNA polymerase sigma factor (sigma-70 family)